MTDAKLYVDRARVATGLGSISSIDTLIFGREIDGVVDSRKYDGAFGALTYKASKGTERVQGGDLDSLESIDQLVFGVELDKIKNFTAGREKLFEDALGGTNRPIVSSVADQPVKPKLRDFGQHRPVRPDPFATHSERLKAALEEHPAHLIAERWSLQRVARAYAFRLEQIGSSLEGSTRNLARLCDALKVGTVVDNRLVALGATDTQVCLPPSFALSGGKYCYCYYYLYCDYYL
ncbi:hypothetical protein T492DRAFT_106923 [Pavlovales sp. CCMP2436]|nr:hypothetical protein T492DRAFT_106923 [Pavlovales sp. CCMP2436]